MEITDPTLGPSKQLLSQGLILQTYCNSVLIQPSVDFTGFDNLTKYQTGINDGLATAKLHATDYLNNIQPSIVSNISNIGNYYQIYNAVPAACPSGSTVDTWLNVLRTLQTQATTYQATSQGIVTSLGTLNSNLGTDTASFATTVSNLNAAVNGDQGVMQSISDNINTIDGQIAGCIAGTALSALAIVGGGFMIAVGGIAEFVTAGTSTALVLGGVAVVATGIGGEVASAVTLSNLYKEKAGMLQQKAVLTSEVNLSLGISSSYSQLKDQGVASMNAATQMQNAWTSLSSDLGNMASDLQKGILSTDTLRTLWLNGANNLVPTILTDISTIKAQMAGVSVANAGSQDLGTYVLEQAHKNAA